jgi:hypothetical protein
MGAAARMVQDWGRAVNDLLPSLHGHTRKALSRFSFAMALAGHCHSGKLAASTPGQAHVASARRAWERLLANDRLDADAAMGELAKAVAQPWAGGGTGGRRLLLVLDETPNQGAGLECLRLGVAYRKRLLNVAAECYPTDEPPRPMPQLIGQMLRKAAAALPPDVAAAQVTLLCDRGLAWPAVLDDLRELGWGHVMRLQGSTRVRLSDGREVAVADLVRRKGQRWSGRAWIFKKAGWRQVHLSVVWDRRCEEPWALAAPPDDAGLRGLRAAEAYLKRGWCEQTFRDEKSGGFRWDQSRVSDPLRAMRLVLVMTLATLLSISLGTWLIKGGRRRELDPHRRRRLSVFQLGLRWLRHRILRHLLSCSSDRDATAPLWPPRLPYLHPA